MAGPNSYYLHLKFSLFDGDGRKTDEIRRLALKTDELKQLKDLKDKVTALYSVLRGEEFNIYYIDDEKDEVIVSSDEELFAAVLFAKRRRNKPLHFTVRVMNYESDFFDYD